mmetsp:Transcript_31597/g.61661  ORF Transcript_31597/g.61661 Transcript_31597/m.61661 type:complete len:226 (-) Transcript_31597:28-705(-)
MGGLGSAAHAKLVLGRGEAVGEAVDLLGLVGLLGLERVLVAALLLDLLVQAPDLMSQLLQLQQRALAVALEVLLLRQPRLHLGDVLLLRLEEPPDLLGRRGEDGLQRALLAEEEVPLLHQQRHLLEQLLLAGLPVAVPERVPLRQRPVAHGLRPAQQPLTLRRDHCPRCLNRPQGVHLVRSPRAEVGQVRPLHVTRERHLRPRGRVGVVLRRVREGGRVDPRGVW